MKGKELRALTETVRQVVMREFELDDEGNPKNDDHYHAILDKHGYKPENKTKTLWGKKDHKGYSQVNLETDEHNGWVHGNWEDEDPDRIGDENGQEQFMSGDDHKSLDKHLTDFHK